MAKQIIEKLIDDIDGGDASETVSFALDGVRYTIDLSEDNASALREALATFVAAGTRSGRETGAWRPGAALHRRQPGRADNKAVREWAAANGHELSDRGRISGAVMEAYEAALKAPAAPSTKAMEKLEVTGTAPGKTGKRASRKKSVPAVQFAAS